MRVPIDPSERPAETFLAGRVKARQPPEGYRAGLDAALLGAAITARAGERLVELGCGSGVAALIAAARNPGACVVGIERDPEAAALARRNAAANEQGMEVLEADVFTLGPAHRERYDHAFLNPPYYNDASAVRAPKAAARRAAFLDAEHSLEEWIGAALGLVKTKGRVTLVHRADRLGDILSAFCGRAGGVRVRPVRPRAGAPANRVLVQARKGGREPLVLLAGLMLHGAEGGLTPEASAILNGECGFALEA